MSALSAAGMWVAGLCTAAQPTHASLDGQLQAALVSQSVPALAAMIDGQALARATLDRPDAAKVLSRRSAPRRPGPARS